MKVEEGKYSIAELVDWYRRRELVVNKEYQRGAGLWPTPAKSYFIDTILNEFPFPKVYFHESVDRATRRPRREIVDGQQRISTIVDFVDGKFSLGKNARGLEGKSFLELSEEQQDTFYMYTVSVDVIRNADRADILQMFRRMNAFTLPLNAPEKRHSQFFGEFKDWVNTVLDKYGSLLINWKIFTSRQVVRMADAEFIADLALAVDEGVVSTTPAKLDRLYRSRDELFVDFEEMNAKITSALSTVQDALSEIQETQLTKPHIFHSLVCALLHNRYGLAGMEHVPTTGRFFENRDTAVSSLIRLGIAHEEKDLSEFPDFVNATSEGGNRAAQRAVRIEWLCKALQGLLA